MSKSYLRLLAIAVAFVVFTGKADAITVNRADDISNVFSTTEQHMRTAGLPRTQFDTLPNLFRSPFQQASWLEASEQALIRITLRIFDYFGSSGHGYVFQVTEIIRERNHDLVMFIWSDYRLERDHGPHSTGYGQSGQPGQAGAPAPTPLPAPLLLLGSGLGLIAFFARRARKQAAIAAA